MRGKFIQNELYCSKQSILYKFGKEPIAGGIRNDTNRVYEALCEGKTDKEIIMDAGFSAYSRTLKAQDRIRLQLKPEFKVSFMTVKMNWINMCDILLTLEYQNRPLGTQEGKMWFWQWNWIHNFLKKGKIHKFTILEIIIIVNSLFFFLTY